MQEIHERIFVANDVSCKCGDSSLAVVHACKSPCHQGAVGYRGNLPSSHPNYLILEDDNNLYLNIIDPPVPLFLPPLFSNFMRFSDQHWKSGKSLLIHCNQGESRAPSLALLFLSKGLSVIDNSSYASARMDFEKIYPRYVPGKGIETYFAQNWTTLGQ